MSFRTYQHLVHVDNKTSIKVIKILFKNFASLKIDTYEHSTSKISLISNNFKFSEMILFQATRTKSYGKEVNKFIL